MLGCKKVTLRKRASREGWDRDLTKQVADAARAKMTPGGSDDDAQAVDSAAEVAATIMLKHRGTVAKGRGLVDGMFAELGEVGKAPEIIEQALRSGLSADEIDIGLVLAAYSLPSRAKSMGALAGSLEKLIRAERDAYNLNEQKVERPFEQSLRELDEQDNADAE